MKVLVSFANFYWLFIKGFNKIATQFILILKIKLRDGKVINSCCDFEVGIKVNNGDNNCDSNNNKKSKKIT